MNRYEIAPGVYLSAIEGGKFKRCLFYISLVLPGSRETATKLALLPHLLTRRCEAVPDPTLLSQKLEELYGADITGESVTTGSARIVTLGLSGLKNQYALNGENLEQEYLDLLCSLLFQPVLENGVMHGGDFAIEKEKQADFLRSEMNDKRSYCLRQARRKLFGPSPLGLESAGYLEDIDALTPENVTQVYKDMLCRAQVEIVVCGADPRAAQEVLAKRFASIERQPETVQARGFAQGAKEMANYTEAMETNQGKLCILLTSGEKLTERQSAAMRVASILLGGLPSSRFFLNVREKQSLCYYCASRYDSMSGLLTVDSGISHENAKRASASIMHELMQMQAEEVTEQELEYARLALANSFVSAKDSPDALASWVVSESLRGSNLTMDQTAELLCSITAGEVKQALSLFSPSVEYVITGKEGK